MSVACSPTTSDLSNQQLVRDLVVACRSLDGLSFSTPPTKRENNVDDQSGNESMPQLSPIPFNAVVSTSLPATLSGLTFSSRGRLSICSTMSLFSQLDTSETSRSDCSSWCLRRGPLHIALSRGFSEADVQEILSKAVPGGDSITRMRDNDGLTPLHLAMKRKAPNEEATLAALKFDPLVANLQDHLGRTPRKLRL
jgi:hypothetical protein